MSSSQTGLKHEDVDVANKAPEGPASPIIIWRKCRSRDGRPYYYNNVTGLSQWKKPLEWESDSEEEEKAKGGQSAVEQESPANALTGLDHAQETGTQEKERSGKQCFSTPDGLVVREHLASTLASMALRSKLNLHDPDVVKKAISLLGEESAETSSKVDLKNRAAIPASEERLAERNEVAPEMNLPGKGGIPQPESTNAQQNVTGSPLFSDGPAKQGSFFDHLLVRKRLPDSILDLDDVQVPAELRNFLTEESVPFLNAALECLPPDSMLTEADHLCLERQRVEAQLCSSRLKLLHHVQTRIALEAQLMVLKAKIAFGDFVTSRKKRKIPDD